MTLAKRLTGWLACAATALTLSAAPAAADLKKKDVAKVLGGIAAIYLLNEALQRERERDRRREAERRQAPRTTARAPAPGRPGETYSHIHADGSGGGGWHEHTVGVPHSQARHAPAPVPRPAPVPQVARQAPPSDPLPELPARRPVEVRLLPAQCRADISNAIETIQGYDAACLQNAVVLPGSLPPQCILRHPDRTIYEAACLRREGWSTRIARN